MPPDSLRIANLIFFRVPGSQCGRDSEPEVVGIDSMSRTCGEGMGSLMYWSCPVHVASCLRGLVPHTLLIELREIPTQEAPDRSPDGHGTPLQAWSPRTHTLAESFSTEHAAGHLHFVPFHLPSCTHPGRDFCPVGSFTTLEYRHQLLSLN